jgi:sporulation protein YlmC with PRC-barrel domain
VNPLAIRIVPKREDAPAVATGLLVHLGDLDEDYMVLDPVPDFRDWPLTLPDKRRVGKVDDLIIDTSTMVGKYLEVHVARDVHLGHDERWILIPVEAVRVDSDQTRVIIDRLPAGGLNGAPRQHGRVPTIDEQRVIHAYFELESTGVGPR